MIDSHIELPDGEESLNFLNDALEFSGVSSVVVIQREASGLVNQACLEQAKQSDGLVCGVVTWAPLADERLLKIQLDMDNREKSVCGYVADIHDQHAESWLSDEDIQYGVKLISEQEKPLDLLLKPSQMPAIFPFLDAHPDMPIVLDHCLGEAADTGLSWRRLMREIGRRPHVSYRLSGLAPAACAETACEATESAREAFDAAWNGFGAERLIYGSGWPVTPARYPVWLNTVDNLIHELSSDEQTAIFTDNAEKVYALDLSD